MVASTVHNIATVNSIESLDSHAPTALAILNYDATLSIASKLHHRLRYDRDAGTAMAAASTHAEDDGA